MAELSPLSILITADADDLKAELAAARVALDKFERGTVTGANKTKAFSGALGALGKVSKESRGKIQLVSYQLQDIAVQMQMGTRTSTVMAQQLPQLAGAFGAVGAAVGVLAAVGIPALAFAFDGLSGGAQDLTTALETIENTMDELRDPMAILKMDVDQLRQKYGEAAEAVRQFAVFQAQARAAQAQASLNDQVSILEDLIGRYYTLTDAGHDYRNTLKRIQADLGMTRDEAVAFENALSDLDAAPTFEGQQAALQRVVDLLDEADIEAGKIPPELARAVDEMITLSNATDEARELMRQLAGEAAGVSIGSGWTFDPVTDMPPPLVDTPDGGRRGGGRKDRTEAELERVRNSLMSQEEAQIASFERQQETLQAALEKKLLTQEEYNALMEDAQLSHSEKMQGIERQQQGAVLSGYAGMFGDLSSLMTSGGKKLFKIGKAASIANATVKGYEAAVEAWDKGMKIGGPPVAGAFAAASLAKTGALISKIGSTSYGGSSGGGGGAASAAAAPSAPPVQNVVWDIRNATPDTMTQVGSLVDTINEAGRQGFVLNIQTVQP